MLETRLLAAKGFARDACGRTSACPDAAWQEFLKRVRPTEPSPAEGQQTTPPPARPAEPWPAALEERISVLSSDATAAAAILSATELTYDSTAGESIDGYKELQQIRTNLESIRRQLVGIAPGTQSGTAANWRSFAVVRTAALSKHNAKFLARKGGVELHEAQFVFAASRVATAARIAEKM